MKIVKVHLGPRSYDIVISHNSISECSRLVKKSRIGNYAYIITHPFIKKSYGKHLENSFKKCGIDFKFKILPETEKTKSIDTAIEVVKDIVKIGKSKNIFLVAFGGGVVGDLTGFVASIYKRGIPYIQIPTTLLAQVDAAIGGKTAVDLKEAKNIIGAFYQPRIVISDTSLLNTLDLRQLRAGLAEVIKYGIIKDKTLFRFLEKNKEKILAKDKKTVEFIIARSSSIKAKIVEADEREEKGLRTILNFGHTFAHAIESASRYRKYNHGEAVSIGMICALEMSYRLKMLNKYALNRAIKLIRSFGLPVNIKGVTLEKIMNSLYYDKKFIGHHTRFVLVEDIGKTAIKQNPPISIVKSVLKERLK